MAYISLFFTAFASATLLPLGSEALFIFLLNDGKEPILLLFIATTGNTLGSFVNYLLGRFGREYALKKGYMKEESINRASSIFSSYGAWSLLLSWAPIIGDSITLVAGVAKDNIWRFLLIVAIAKLGRYMAVYWGFLAILQ